MTLPEFCCVKCAHYRATSRRRGLCSFLVSEIMRPRGTIVDRHVCVRFDDRCGEYLDKEWYDETRKESDDESSD